MAPLQEPSIKLDLKGALMLWVKSWFVDVRPKMS